MHIYLTHCCKDKADYLRETGEAVTPDELYVEPEIQEFMARCKEKAVHWAILSDLYGVYFANEKHRWYEKHPDTVTPQEEEMVIQEFNHKLSPYDEIFFFVRTESFHPFYGRVLKRTVLANQVKIFQDLGCIE
jgi:hypothetical protein